MVITYHLRMEKVLQMFMVKRIPPSERKEKKHLGPFSCKKHFSILYLQNSSSFLDSSFPSLRKNKFAFVANKKLDQSSWVKH